PHAPTRPVRRRRSPRIAFSGRIHPGAPEQCATFFPAARFSDSKAREMHESQKRAISICAYSQARGWDEGVFLSVLGRRTGSRGKAAENGSNRFSWATNAKRSATEEAGIHFEPGSQFE